MAHETYNTSVHFKVRFFPLEKSVTYFTLLFLKGWMYSISLLKQLQTIPCCLNSKKGRKICPAWNNPRNLERDGHSKQRATFMTSAVKPRLAFSILESESEKFFLEKIRRLEEKITEKQMRWEKDGTVSVKYCQNIVYISMNRVTLLFTFAFGQTFKWNLKHLYIHRTVENTKII